MGDLLGFLLIGLVGGACGAMVGLGGATFIIPLATLILAPDTQQLRAAAMVSNTCVAAGALLPYARAGQVDWRLVWRIAPWAAMAVGLGVWVSVGIDAVLYRGLFGLFVLLLVARDVVQLLRPPATEAPVRELSGLAGACTGLVAGIVGGVLSVGGGVIFVPVLRTWLHLPAKRAAAASMAMVLPSMMVGAVAQMWSMSTLPHPGGGTMLPGAVTLALCLAPAAILGGWLGACLNTRLPRAVVSWAMAAALTVAALLLLRPWLERLTLSTPA